MEESKQYFEQLKGQSQGGAGAQERPRFTNTRKVTKQEIPAQVEEQPTTPDVKMPEQPHRNVTIVQKGNNGGNEDNQ